MWVYFLTNKSDALISFKKFKAHVEDGPKKWIRTLRTDRGGEFCSQEFSRFYDENGINRNFTAPYYPQHNRVVERRNCTMVSMARSLLKQMNFPLTLWPEAVRHFVYLLNRLPTRAVTGRTPYEVWKEKNRALDI
ncbi:hypothetical protein AgCh_000959 [Apium graveolens]